MLMHNTNCLSVWRSICTLAITLTKQTYLLFSVHVHKLARNDDGQIEKIDEDKYIEYCVLDLPIINLWPG